LSREENVWYNQINIKAVKLKIWHYLYGKNPLRRNKMSSLVPVERIESNILLMRGQKVILDKDLAELYGVA